MKYVFNHVTTDFTKIMHTEFAQVRFSLLVPTYAVKSPKLKVLYEDLVKLMSNNNWNSDLMLAASQKMFEIEQCATSDKIDEIVALGKELEGYGVVTTSSAFSPALSNSTKSKK